MDIIDDVPFRVARDAVRNGDYLMIVDRMLATQAYKNSGEWGANLAGVFFLTMLAAIPLAFVFWPAAIASALASHISLRILRRKAVAWVRLNAFASEELYYIFARHRVIWFTWP